MTMPQCAQAASAFSPTSGVTASTWPQQGHSSVVASAMRAPPWRAILATLMTRPVRNPPNPWQTVHVELLGEPPAAALEVHEERARSIVAENDSPDVPFRFSVNPYRGCQHACAYCYARPSHELLGWGAGTDFDTRIVVKLNAPELLEQKLSSRSWTRELIAFSGVTDCYQPLEASYELTRRCLQVCLAHRQPVGVI